MLKRSALATIAVLGAFAVTGHALAACTVGRIAELPVTMAGMRPVISAKVNDADARFLADSGAFYSMLSPAGAAQLGLKLHPAPITMRVTGVGGDARIWVATVKRFTLAEVPIPDAEFFVGGSEPGEDVVGVVGQNVLAVEDTEYDLANGVIRLMHPNGCGGKVLAYWARSLPYSVLLTPPTTPLAPHVTAVAYVNGVKVRVMFDTGAATSILSLAAAAHAGVTPQSAGVIPDGLSGGVGRKTIDVWVAPVASFKIGDEEVKNTRLRIGATTFLDADMLIGADFFLSHRVYVAKSQGKLYFTYNGGPVFNLTARAPPAVAATAPTAGAALPTQTGAEGPADAAGLSRRGAAFAARRDYLDAIADLTRASALAPREPQYLYQRALAYLGNQQPFLAMEDLDQALKLKGDDVPALMARAGLRLAGHERAPAIADLDAAASAAPRESDARLAIGELYARGDSFGPAIGQYGLWITAHPDDSRRVQALNGRCWARALWGQELDKALADCDAALKLGSRSAGILDSRGLVHLRLGDFDEAIADYDAALALRPKSAWSLYGRGLARLHKGMSAEGDADIAAAVVLSPLLPDEARKRGIAP
jgi:tetratricopeptide (TPR) repeat protein/predicted aspartyl protease